MAKILKRYLKCKKILDLIFLIKAAINLNKNFCGKKKRPQCYGIYGAIKFNDVRITFKICKYLSVQLFFTIL